jgi:hypothetical protein
MTSFGGLDPCQGKIVNFFPEIDMDRDQQPENVLAYTRANKLCPARKNCP